MSYNVDFYRLAKKENSTKLPTGQPTETFDCEILAGSSVLAPTLKLNTNFINPSNLTYAHILNLTKYYFVTNWRYDKGLWYCDLVEDILATYKTEIGALSMYVLRSASEMDGRLIDSKYVVKVGASFDVAQNNANPLAVSVSNGWFVVGIFNGDSSAVGVTSYYVFTNAEFRTFAAFLMGNASYLQSPAEISDALLKCLVNPTDYITSCTWLPIQPPVGAALTQIPIGWWTVTASCHRLSGYSRTGATCTVSVPKHPLAATRGYYLLQEPYSKYYLDFPPFGNITIPANDLVDTTLIQFTISIDCITGQGRLQIDAGPTGAIGTIDIMYAQVGVPVALAQNAPQIPIPTQRAPDTPIPEWSPDPNAGTGQNLKSFFGWAGAHVSKGVDQASDYLGLDLKRTASNLINAAVGAEMPIQVIGGNGGFMSGYFPVRLIGTFASISDDNTAEWGRPLCRTKTLNTLTGFIQCADADFEISCTAVERDAIAGYLTGGFYME